MRAIKRWDVHSPFPIHGMDDAMGLGKSWLSAVVLCGGITGLLTACVLTFGPSSFLYPLIVHGKPYQLLDGAGVLSRSCLSSRFCFRPSPRFSPGR